MRYYDKIVLKASRMKTRGNKTSRVATFLAGLACLLVAVDGALAQDLFQQRLSTPRNQSSQRYEINQTYDGQVFRKDNNVWVYTKEFADLFGMPTKHIEDVQGVVAAAFRIEDRSYQECGFGGQEHACRKSEDCLIDLYFDEKKTPLPWATEIKSQWLPLSSSTIWLRPLDSKERPHGVLAMEPAPGIIRNAGLHGQLVPFADPVSKREATFTSNIRSATGDEEHVSGPMALLGYTKDFYKGLTVVNLQFGCTTFFRNEINIRLDSKKDVMDAPIARFNRIVLPRGFVQRIKELQKQNSDRNAVFYRSLLTPPLDTRGTSGAQPGNTNQ